MHNEPTAVTTDEDKQLITVVSTRRLSTVVFVTLAASTFNTSADATGPKNFLYRATRAGSAHTLREEEGEGQGGECVKMCVYESVRMCVRMCVTEHSKVAEHSLGVCMREWFENENIKLCIITCVCMRVFIP